VIEKILTHLGLQVRAPPRAPARGQALQAESGHKQSSGLFVPGKGSGHWPDAPCKGPDDSDSSPFSCRRGERGRLKNLSSLMFLLQVIERPVLNRLGFRLKETF